MSFPCSCHGTAELQSAPFTSRHAPSASLRTMSALGGGGGSVGLSGGENAAPAFGGGFGAPAYGLSGDDTVSRGTMVDSLPDSKIAQ
ncbi:MAG: hypothetical protein ACO3QC_05395 [Phycisphaerales bacterium]